MHRPCNFVLALLAFLLTLGLAATVRGELKHPYMLWTPEEAARIAELTRKEPWSKAAAEKETNPLVRYGILQDKAAGEAERAALLRDLAVGNVATVANADRYDVLYDLLTPEQRQQIKAAFVKAVEAGMDTMAKQTYYTRWNWLPNLNYKWYSDLHVVAAATGDEALIKRMFASQNGFKWYLDEYLSDSGFYNEEFSKMYNTPQGLAAWCWALERAGLNEMGWGYKGRQGATMRGHLESLLLVAYPKVDIGTARPVIPRMTIGDTRGRSSVPAYGFQHTIAPGATEAGPQSSRQDWYVPLLEIPHAKWPDAGYGYFLAANRGPKEDTYLMPLRFGLPPVGPDAKPPAAPSGVYEGRGVAMLRAEESSTYWDSPAPAVGMRLATPYAHHVQDSFALTGFYAYNRPLFVNHAHSTNYTGVDPGYSNSARSHSIVLVDRLEPNSLLEHAHVRKDLGPQAKVLIARAKGIFPGVDQTRALVLTRDYLVDVSHLVSDHARDYLWQVQTFGHACPDNPRAWAPSTDLKAWIPDYAHESSAATDQTWTVTAVQTTGGANKDFSGVGPSWFAKRIGVRVTMLGEPGTHVYTAWSPVVADTSGRFTGRNRFIEGEEEPAATAIVATRRAAATTFAAVHEPFDTTAKIRSIKRLAEGPDYVCLVISADTYRDYVMLRFGDKAAEPLTITSASAPEAFEFTGHGYLRVTTDKVTRTDGVARYLVPSFSPDQKATRWHAQGAFAGTPEGQAVAPDLQRTGPMAARFREVGGVNLPTAGKGMATLLLRNNGQTPMNATLALTATRGLTITPASIDVRNLPPGGETQAALALDASKAEANTLAEVVLNAPIAQRAVLAVANGLAGQRQQLGAEFCQIMQAPRYTARFWYMDAGAALELFDPAGFRRHDATGLSYPAMLQQVASADGKVRSEAKSIPKFAYFIPLLIKGPAGEPARYYEGGKHAHGAQSGLEHVFTEDFLIVRSRNAAATDVICFEWQHGSRLNGLEQVYLGRDPDLAAAKVPGKLIVVDAAGKAQEIARTGGKRPGLKSAGAVSAIFDRPDGFAYGMALFYPPESKLQNGQVYQPGDKAMAMSFCTEAEFPALLERWRAMPNPPEIAPTDAARYHGAFGASPVPAER